MKKMILGVLFAASLLQPVSCLASETISVEKNAVQLYVDGKKLETDSFLYQGTTYVPIRAVSEGLNANVQYNGQTSSANITKTISFDRALAAEQGLRFLNMYYVHTLYTTGESIYDGYNIWNPEEYLAESSSEKQTAQDYFQFYSSYTQEISNLIYDLQLSALYPSITTINEMENLMSEYEQQLRLYNGNYDSLWVSYLDNFEKLSNLRQQLAQQLHTVEMTLLEGYSKQN